MANDEKAVENTEQDAEKPTQDDEKINEQDAKAKSTKAKNTKAKNTKVKSNPKDDDEEEEESEAEEQFGLFDKPLVIEGKRERKKTEFLVKDKQEIKKPLPLVFHGKGDALGSMEVVNHELSRCTSLELKPLHKLLFGRDGRSTEIKRNIRLFNGFNIEKGTKEYENKKFSLERFTNEGLKRLLEILDLEKKGTREDLKERVFEFLLNPKETGRSLKTVQMKTEKKTKSKKSKGKGAKRKRTSKKSKDKEVKEDDERDKEDDDDEEEEKKTEEPKKKKAKTETPTKTKSTPSKSKSKTPSKKEVKKEAPKETKAKKSPKKTKLAAVTVKITAGKRTPKKTAPKKPVDDESSSDDEPLAKKIKKQEPTNEELAQTVKDLLIDANLDQVTVKSISKQVFEKFPDFDLSAKKGFIKETVYSVISGEAE